MKKKGRLAEREPRQEPIYKKWTFCVFVIGTKIINIIPINKKVGSKSTAKHFQNLIKNVRTTQTTKEKVFSFYLQQETSTKSPVCTPFPLKIKRNNQRIIICLLPVCIKHIDTTLTIILHVCAYWSLFFSAT